MYGHVYNQMHHKCTSHWNNAYKGGYNSERNIITHDVVCTKPLNRF